MADSNHPKTFADLKSALINDARGDGSVTAVANQASRMLNTALYDILLGNGEHFPWAHRRANLLTQPRYNTGTVSISQGSTTLTGTDTLWNTNNAFSTKNARSTGKIVIAGTPEVYDIQTVTDDTSITLSSKYVGEDVTDGSYDFFEDEIALADDFLKPVDFRSFDLAATIELIGQSKFRSRYPRNSTPGKPYVGAIFDNEFSTSSTARKRRIVLHPPPAEAMKIDYVYVTGYLAVTSAGDDQQELSADTDEPILPLHYRHAIVWKALADWYLNRKNDERYMVALTNYERVLERMLADHDVGRDMPRIQPRLGPYAHRARRPYNRRGSSRYSGDSRFDQLRDR